MELEQLLLRKEELPISLATVEVNGFRSPFFEIPIYPKLLSDEISLNPRIANNVFEQAAKEWYEDLKLYLDSDESEPERDWTKRVFYDKGLNITREYDEIYVNEIWKDSVTNFKNGFAFGLSISRNAGGSLVIPFGEIRNQYVGFSNVLFSPEKFRAYRSSNREWDYNNSTIGYLYGQHNIDNYPGALFLRNWGILYLNQAMKELAAKDSLI